MPISIVNWERTTLKWSEGDPTNSRTVRSRNLTCLSFQNRKNVINFFERSKNEKQSTVRFDHQHTAILATGYLKILCNSIQWSILSVLSRTHLLGVFQQGTRPSTLYVPKSTSVPLQILWHTSSRVLFRVPWTQYIH